MTYIAVKKNSTVLLFMIYICHSTLMLPCLPTHLGVFYIIRLNFNRYDDVGAVATYRSDQQNIFSLIIICFIDHITIFCPHYGAETSL